jgi:hypothetical protein
MTLAQLLPPRALGDVDQRQRGVRLQRGRGYHALQADLGQRVQDSQQCHGPEGGPAGIDAAVLHFLVDVHRAVPGAVDVDRDEQPGYGTALPADPRQAQPAAGDREDSGAVMQDREQPGDREADQDRVLDYRHADLGARGNADADHRDDQYDDCHGGGDGDIGPGAAGTGAGHGEHGRPEDDDLGHGADHVARDHQPAGQEAQVGADSAADPLERRAAGRVPHVEPPVGVSDDQHGNGGKDDDRAAAVGGRRR